MSDNGTLAQVSRRQAIKVSAGALALPVITGESVLAAPRRPGVLLPVGRNQNFNRDWQFHRGTGVGLERPDYPDHAWRTLDLPHDWSIEDVPPSSGSEAVGPFDPKAVGGSPAAFSVGGEGWYRKHFSLAAGTAHGPVEILFDGIYGESDVWLNGQHIGQNVHGYTPISLDLTPHVQTGENVLAIRVRNMGRNSRWYSGSGIYRGVTVDVMREAARIARWGIGVSTTRLDDAAAELAVETRLADAASGLTVINRVRAPGGAIVGEATAPADGILRQVISVRSPRLWSPDRPILYTLETQLRRGASMIDRVETTFGVRIVTFDSASGMQINGTPVKLRGGCIHHDNGLLGSAAYPDAEERRVRLLKARGYNAIRSSHYPASRAFADACDRQGMLLIEEAFDMWEVSKTPDDYAKHFPEWWERDLTAMVLSARNHPSVIMWSIGNEIPGRLSPRGREISWNLANTVHRLDPTRPVTAGVNGLAGRPMVPDEATARPGRAGIADEPSAMFLDVVGYNYKRHLYASDHVRYPERVIYGSESFPKELFDTWEFIDAHPHVIGDFVWTAMDYLGEAGIGSVVRNEDKVSIPFFPSWPWVVSNCGDIDLVGKQKPQSHARDVVWGLSPIEMSVQRPVPDGMYEHSSLWGWSDEQPSWTWPGAEGKPLAVRVYTRADRIELRLNGKPVADRPVRAGERLPLEFSVGYAPGTLEAIAFRGGREIGRRRLETVGPPAAVTLTAEQPTGRATRGALSYVLVELRDASGRAVPDVARKVHLSVSGPAELIGFGSANPLARGSYQAPEAETFDGRALAILKADGRPGTLRINALSEGLKRGSTTVRLN